MISKEMEKALNKQISFEGYASFLYLSMATWADSQGLQGCYRFLSRQSEEEREHMLKFFKYLSDVDAKAITPGIEAPPHDFDSIQNIFKAVYAHEQKVTKSINELMALAVKENDFTTQTFLQWFVNEQIEEEMVIRSILDRLKLIGDGPQSLYFIDKEVESIIGQMAAASADEGESE
jgi:ferritin